MGRKPKIKKEESKSVEFDGIKNETKEIKKENIIPDLTKEQKEKRVKLNTILKDINKSMKGCVINYANTVGARERLSFGYECLDKLTNGGMPRGLYTTVYGSKACGKTSIAYKAIATTQKSGKIAAYIDMERGFDKERASLFGVTDDLVYIAVHTAEEAMDIVIKLCKEKVVDLIVLDSIQGMSPKGEQVEGKSEKEKSVEADTMALLARKLSQFFRMATSYVSDANCAVLLIGQVRIDLGSFIKLETLAGGCALAHNSRLTLRCRRGQKSDSPMEKIETDEVNENGKPIFVKKPIGFDMVITVEKSQITGCTEGSELHVPYYYTDGIRE